MLDEWMNERRLFLRQLLGRTLLVFSAQLHLQGVETGAGSVALSHCIRNRQPLPVNGYVYPFPRER